MSIFAPKRSVVLALALAAVSAAHADPFSFVTWDLSTNTGSSVKGTIQSDQGTIGVTLRGGYDVVRNDESKFFPESSFTGGIVGNGPGVGAFVQVSTTTAFTLSFDRSITNLALDLWSVGNGNQVVTYDFDRDFSLVAGGPNAQYGGGPLVQSGRSVTGQESNGTLLFDGPISSMGFQVNGPEVYHGFTLGLAKNQPVPEPASMLALAGGVAALGRSRRRRG